ncbi:hypothetical protein ACFO0N_12385 [Halobium salinum]|uniref:DUF8119 domain-containing protein n=1 Tax=Halobium salinum TaxID=1364940 RepID=A0ABD5PCS2_9EURY|nr:hypothetical protein [Halobium salinum]
MSRLEAVGEHVRDHRSGMVVDLVFALVWVTVVSALFGFLSAPQWATYLAMGLGVVAYFGFFWSLEATRGSS